MTKGGVSEILKEYQRDCRNPEEKHRYRHSRHWDEANK